MTETTETTGNQKMMTPHLDRRVGNLTETLHRLLRERIAASVAGDTFEQERIGFEMDARREQIVQIKRWAR